ncbi:ABC transporter substrate-binding protein [Paenibacillus thalictri]|nr:extracellular solute-binding protein [Paenibacillus thalictri]
MLTSIVSGCSGGSPNAGANDAGKPQESAPKPSGASKVTIDFWVATGNQETAVKNAAEDFKKLNPNIEVKITSHATDPHKEALKVAAASGTLPDGWFNWGGSLGSYFPENGFSLDLTEYAKQNNWSQKYVKSAMDLATFKNQLSGVPFHIYGMGVFYRKDVFEKLGLKPPATFQEFEDLMAKLKAGGITPISSGGKGGWMPMRFMEGVIEHFAGPDLHDKLGKMEASWNDPAVVKAYQKWKEWSDKGYFPKGFLTLEPSEAKIALYKGTAAMMLEGPWFDGNVIADQQNPESFGYFSLPTDQNPNRVSSFVEMFQINKKSPKEKQEAAIKFAEYITSIDNVKKNGEVLGAPMATIDAPLSDKLIHVPQIVEGLKKGVYLVTDQALPQEIVQKFFQAQDSIVTGEMTPEAAAKFMQDEVVKYQAKAK